MGLDISKVFNETLMLMFSDDQPQLAPLEDAVATPCYLTKMYIEFAPYLHQKIQTWG